MTKSVTGGLLVAIGVTCLVWTTPVSGDVDSRGPLFDLTLDSGNKKGKYLWDLRPVTGDVIVNIRTAGQLTENTSDWIVPPLLPYETGGHFPAIWEPGFRHYMSMVENKCTLTFGFVAFSVGKSSHQRVSGPAVITFDREFLNSGNAFDLLTNTFTCPKPGIYAFHLHGLSGDNDKRFLAGIYKNNDLMVTAYTRVREFWSMAGNTVLFELHTGDTVQAKLMYGQNDVYGDNTELYATFSGYEIS